MPNQGMPVDSGNKTGISLGQFSQYSQFDTNELSNSRDTHTENTHWTDYMDVQ